MHIYVVLTTITEILYYVNYMYSWGTSLKDQGMEAEYNYRDSILSEWWRVSCQR